MKKFKDKITLNIIIASLITIILGFSSVTSAQNFRYGAGNRFESCNERGYLPGTIQLKRGEWVKIRVLQYSGGFLISGSPQIKITNDTSQRVYPKFHSCQLGGGKMLAGVEKELCGTENNKCLMWTSSDSYDSSLAVMSDDQSNNNLTQMCGEDFCVYNNWGKI